MTQDGRHDGATAALLAGGVAGPLLFIVVFLIEGATRPGYSAARNMVSDLAMSDAGWQQIANFLVCGTLMLGFAIGLSRRWRTGVASRWGPRLIGVFGLGLIVAGVFVTDPARGYPPGAPLTGEPQTVHGIVHGINAIPTFGALVAAAFVVAGRFPRDGAWARYSRFVGWAVLALFIVGTPIGVLEEHQILPPVAGIVQRVEIVIAWTWLSLIAWREVRTLISPSEEPSTTRPT
jgi:uncharacterized protein DUF998